jgi:hypothetical protein
MALAGGGQRSWPGTRGRPGASRVRADHPAAQAEDVHVVVLHALVGGVGVVGDGRPHAADLVGRHAGPDPGAADEDPPVRLSVADRIRQAAGEVRVVVGRVRAVAAEVDQLVAGIREAGEELRLELGAAVIGGEGDAHQRVPPG